MQIPGSLKWKFKSGKHIQSPLTDADVQELYTNIGTNLEAYYKLDEGSGTNAVDLLEPMLEQ